MAAGDVETVSTCVVKCASCVISVSPRTLTCRDLCRGVWPLARGTTQCCPYRLARLPACCIGIRMVSWHGMPYVCGACAPRHDRVRKTSLTDGRPVGVMNYSFLSLTRFRVSRARSRARGHRGAGSRLPSGCRASWHGHLPKAQTCPLSSRRVVARRTKRSVLRGRRGRALLSRSFH